MLREKERRREKKNHTEVVEMEKSLDIKQVDQSSRKKPPEVKKTSEKEEGPFICKFFIFLLPLPIKNQKVANVLE
jgi:hypothetical protein